MMKTKKDIFKILFTATLGVISLSCGKDEAIDTGNGGKDGSPGDDLSGPYSLSISARRGQVPDGDIGTRAYLDLDNYAYYWDPAEKVVMTIAHQGTLSPVTGFNKIVLTGTNTGRALHANFSGNLTQAQFDDLSAETVFDYYSYYPTNINNLNNTSFPENLQFTIPSTFSISPGVFVDAVYAPMVAIEKDKEQNITFPIGQTTYEHDDMLHLNYQHVVSYAAIEMDVRLLPDKVTRITMTVGNSITDDTRINGTYTYNVTAGTGRISEGSNSVIINIPGGLDAGEVVYIPMPVKNFMNQTFKFTFVTAGSSGNAYREIPAKIAGINFEKGQIHKIKVAPSAQYVAGTSFTVTKTGYYYIEAWGGNGGNGATGRGTITGTDGAPGGAGGIAQPHRGLVNLSAGSTLYVQVGTAGSNGTGNTYSQGGGKSGGGLAGNPGSGEWFGSGYTGGAGGNGSWTGTNIGSYVGGGGGGGGGGASGLLLNGIATSNIIFASGGAGGGAGGGGNYQGGTGGNTNTAGTTSSTGAAGNSWSTSSTNGVLGSNINGTNGSALRRGGGGGGGAGGGWDGASGGGGQSGGGGNDGSNAGGGGGAGGKSFGGTTYLYSDHNDRPSGRADGYVVITFIRNP